MCLKLNRDPCFQWFQFTYSIFIYYCQQIKENRLKKASLYATTMLNLKYFSISFKRDISKANADATLCLKRDVGAHAAFQTRLQKTISFRHAD